MTLLANFTGQYHFPMYRLADLIRTAILNNEFMQHLDSAQVDAIVECMVEVKCYKDDLIIKEGDEGVRVYVLSGVYLLRCNAFL